MSITKTILGEARSSLKTGGDPRTPEYWVQQLFGGGGLTTSGVPMDEDTALTLSAYWNGINIISGAIGWLPIMVYERKPDGGRKPAPTHPVYTLVHDRPNPYMDALTFKRTLEGHVKGWGNGYAAIERNGSGVPKALWPRRPDRTTPETKSIMVDGKPEMIVVYRTTVDGKERLVPFWDMLHIKGLGFDGLRGYSLVNYARDSLGAAKAAETHGASIFRNNGTPASVLTHPGVLDEDGETNLRKSWEQYRGAENTGKMAILEEGMDIKTIGLSNKDAQLLTTRKFDIAEIARWLNIPVHMLKEMDRSTFNNIEHQGIEFVTWTLTPSMVGWEQEINYKLFGPTERTKFFAEFIPAALLRGDTKTRYEAYRIAIASGWLQPDEARRFENMNPDDALAYWQIPLNVQPIRSEERDGRRTIVVVEGFERRADARIVEPPRALPAPPPSSPEHHEERDEGEPEPDEFRELFEDTWSRIVTKEVNGLRRLAKKPDDPEGRIGDFYDKHVENVRAVLGPVLKAFGATPEAIEEEAAKYIEDSRADLLSAIEKGSALDMLAEWKDNKARRMTEEFVTRGEG